MRDYLIDFLEKFEYEKPDRDILLKAYDDIMSTANSKELWLRAQSIYRDNMHCDYGQIISLADTAADIAGVSRYTAELLIFICLSQRTEELYRQNGIDESIFHNSMLDLKYKLDECKKVKGVCGSFVAWWFGGFFELERFALGRLQFEIVSFGENYKELTPLSKVINVHIPRTLTPLSKAECDRAYAMAEDFFKDKTGKTYDFVCDSWLLYPENREILDKNSNVYRFMSEYEIVKWGINEDDRDLWRLFDTDEKDPYKLPHDTSMRRRYIEHLKKGGKTGWGYGLRRK